MKLTFDLLPIAAVVISLILAYFPKVKSWWSAVDSANKQTWMIVVYALVAGGAWGLSQAGVVEVYPMLDAIPWHESLKLVGVDFVIAMVANVVTYESTNYVGNRG